MKTVDMTTALQIQSQISEWVNEGREIFDDGIASPYTEAFYDNCVVYWEGAGYDKTEVAETVAEAVKELQALYA